MKQIQLFFLSFIICSNVSFAQKWNLLKNDTSSWTPTGSVDAIALDKQGNIYAGGLFNNNKQFNYSVAKWNGSDWIELGAGSNALVINAQINAVVVDATGNVYAGGNFTNTNGQQYVVKWNGTSWTSLGNTNNGIVANNGIINTMAVDVSGNVYAGGTFSNSNGGFVAKWDGKAWSELKGTNSIFPNGWINSITLDASGNVYVAALFGSEAQNQFVAKWDGNSWSKLGSGTNTLNDSINAIVVATSGNVYAAGAFTDANGNGYIAKWDGTTWSELGTGENALITRGDQWINSIAVDASENVYAGGYFIDTTSKYETFVAKWNGASWSELGTSTYPFTWYPIFSLTVDSLYNVYSAAIDASKEFNELLVAKWTADTTTHAPIVIKNINYCGNALALPLIAKGTALKWYMSAVGGTALASTPIPSTNSIGSTTYYVSQTLNNQEGPRASITVTIMALPASPHVQSTMTYCQGSITNALSASGTNLKWYTVRSAGNSNARIVPSTVNADTTYFYVSQTINTCESSRDSVEVIIIASPTKPLVTSDSVAYCLNAPTISLTATGTDVKWYSVSVGGNALASTPVPLTTSGGITNFYATQTINGCESARVRIVINVIAPTEPIVTETVNYCVNDPSTILKAKGTSLNWYPNATGGLANVTAPTPVTSSIGANNYYVSQTINGCESGRSIITVQTFAFPASPSVGQTVSYCQNSVSNALIATGTNLKWYKVSVAGSSSTLLVPPTTIADTVYYYVSQTINGCESKRDSVEVIIIPLPTEPIVVNSLRYCLNDISAPLTATGINLKWYTTSNGGNSLPNAPVPSTSIVSTTKYYVTQTINGCESARALISVLIDTTSRPDVMNLINYCLNDHAIPLTASGMALNWYAIATGGIASSIAPTPISTNIDTVYYYVSQTLNGCESSRSMISVRINPFPVASITVGSLLPVCTNASILLTSSNGSSYEWLNGNNELVASSQVFKTTLPNNYRVIVTNAAGCSDTSAISAVTFALGNCYDCANVLNGSAVLDNCNVCTSGTTGLKACTVTGIINSIGSSAPMIYPQPFDYTTIISLSNNDIIQTISICNASGSIVNVLDNINKKEIKIGEDLASGLYIIIIQTKETTYTSRIVKIN
jgi:hypothetical protein